MKHLILLISITLLFVTNGYSQETKKDTRCQFLKEHGNNFYRSDQISDLDLIQALEVAGIRIYKFNIGEFDKKYNFYLMVDEYIDGEIVKTDTLIDDNNQYHYYETGTKEYFLDFIDQIKIFTKDEENKSSLHIRTYKISTKKEIVYKKTDENQFYNWRSYSITSWKLDKKIPLMVYASSWKDKKYGFHRFCGVVNLSQNDERTEKLLSSSPHYFVIYYKVTDIEN
ncbi:MAG: DUF5041 domain-containing protein [Bacteroidetes bacterium]|nr:DUF5041 domain-containing protein [Bacteroidota bacterium]